MSLWTESEFHSFDGVRLFFRYREPAQPTKNSVIVLHRGHEHSGRVVACTDQMVQGDYWSFGFDMRGHGRSDGERAWAESFDVWVKDLNSFAGMLANRFGIKTFDCVLVANSVGSATAVAWILNYAPNLRGCVLAAPAFSIRLYIPFAYPALKGISRLSKRLFVTSYVRSSLLTSHKEEARAYDQDPLITRKIGVSILVSLFDTMKRVFKRLSDFETPVLIFSAATDFVVNNRFHEIFYAGISSKIKKHIKLPGFRHAIFHEVEQKKVTDLCRAFLQERFANTKSNALAMVVEPRTHTIKEFASLSQPSHSIKPLYFAALRWALEKFGRQSEGMSIGLKHGFDSGLSLDYVYQNKAKGRTRFGRLVDYLYLNSVGWKGVRKRKQHLKACLTEIVKQTVSEGNEPAVIDVAAGAGRYLFEVRNELACDIDLHLNDLDPTSLTQAKTNANGFPATYSDCDIFDGSLSDVIMKQPNIAIVSGVFELYANNDGVTRTLSDLHKFLADDGWLIYTGQPWHPQLESIARLLNNRLGNRWVMRRRIQNEMDELVEAAGFEKIQTMTDELGIFTVSCARRIQST